MKVEKLDIRWLTDAVMFEEQDGWLDQWFQKNPELKFQAWRDALDWLKVDVSNVDVPAPLPIVDYEDLSTDVAVAAEIEVLVAMEVMRRPAGSERRSFVDNPIRFRVVQHTIDYLFLLYPLIEHPLGLGRRARARGQMVEDALDKTRYRKHYRIDPPLRRTTLDLGTRIREAIEYSADRISEREGIDPPTPRPTEVREKPTGQMPTAFKDTSNGYQRPMEPWEDPALKSDD